LRCDPGLRIYQRRKPMNRNTKLAIAVAVVLVLAGFGVWHFTGSPAASPGTTEQVTIGGTIVDGNGLLYIAEELGFFTRNGLNVTEKNYDSGSAAARGVIKGEVDIGFASEYVLVSSAFDNSTIRAIGSIDKGAIVYIVGRKDRGIGNISDLKGKRIGFPRGTMNEFYLGSSLGLQGIGMRDIIPVSITKSESADILVNGSVDAVVTTQPYITTIRNRIGQNAMVMPAQNNRYSYGLVICNSDWITKNPVRVSRFIVSLAMADDYVVAHPAEAKAIIRKRMNYSDEEMDSAWQNNQFELSLDQSLLVSMNDEGRWMLANNLTSEKNLPDFRNFIDTSALQKVRPASVDIR
jgi:NitT/TauT family transport system substrate-binding protein